MTDDGNVVSGLDIVIQSPAAAETLAGVKQGLDQVGTAATQSAANVDAHTAATDRNTAAQARAKAAYQAYNAEQQNLTRAQIAYITASESQREAMERLYGITAQSMGVQDALAASTTATTAALEQEAAATEAATAATTGYTTALGGSVYVTRQMSIGLAMIGAQTLGVSSQFGRIGDVALIAAGGMNTALMVTLAFTAGIGVYEGLSHALSGMSAEQEKATAALAKWNQENQLGPAATRIQQVQAEGQAISHLASQFDALHAVLSAITSLAGGQWLDILTGKQALATLGQINTSQQLVTAGNADIAMTQTQANAGDLATLITNGRATAAELRQAEATLQFLENDLARGLNVPGTGPASLADSAKIVDMIHELNDALSAGPQQKLKDLVNGIHDTATAIEAASKPWADMYTAWEKATIKGNAMMASLADEARLATTTGYAHDVLALSIKHENDLRDANLLKYPEAIQAAKDAADAAYAEGRAHLLTAQTVKDEIAARGQLGGAMKEVATIGERNVEIAKKQSEEYLKQQQYVEDMERIAAHGIEQITTNGLRSWSAFFDSVERLFTRLLEKMEQDSKDAQGLGAQTLGYGAIALASGSVGYSVGQTTTNQTVGAGEGALAGAAEGAALGSILPGIGTAVGAVVGGVAGLVGGLMGSAQKLHELQQQFAQDEASFISSLTQQVNQYVSTDQKLYDDYEKLRTEAAKAHTSVSQAATDAFLDARASNKADALTNLSEQIDALTGPAGSYADSLTKIYQQYDQNVKMVNDLHLGEAALTEARMIELDAIKQLNDAMQAAKANLFQDLGDQLSASVLGGSKYQQQLEAIEEQYQKNVAQAQQLGYYEQLATEIEEIRTNQIAQLNAQQQQANDRATDSYYVRYLNASGDTTAGATEQLYFQQQQEMEDAIAQGLDQTALGMLAQAQAAERQQALLQQQQATLQNLLDTQKSALQTAQSSLDATTKTEQALVSFGQSLAVGSLSPLSPKDQLDAARQSAIGFYNEALGGDQTAAQQFTTAAQTFLQLSQGYNASGPGYQLDYNSVKVMTDALTDKYGAQQSLQQQMVDLLQQQVDLLQTQLDVAKALPGQETTGFAAAVTTLINERAATDQAFSAQIQQLGTALGYGSPVVQALVSQKASYDANATQQITLLQQQQATLQQQLSATQALPGGINDQHALTLAQEAAANAAQAKAYLNAAAGNDSRYTLLTNDQLTPGALDSYRTESDAQRAADLAQLVQRITQLGHVGITTTLANGATQTDTGRSAGESLLDQQDPAAYKAFMYLSELVPGGEYYASPNIRTALLDPFYTSAQNYNGSPFATSSYLQDMGFALQNANPSLAVASTAAYTPTASLDIPQSQLDEATKQTGLLTSIKDALNANNHLYGIPAYASGGAFGGGLRLVGEQGPELEFTGPSNIVSNRDVRNAAGMNTAEVVAELRAVREAMSAQGTADVRQRNAGFQTVVAEMRALRTENAEIKQELAMLRNSLHARKAS